MTLDDLKAAKRRSVGAKQTAKALQRREARAVFVARDAEEFVTRDILAQARAQNVEIVLVESMAALGRACAIEVGAATAAVLND